MKRWGITALIVGALLISALYTLSSYWSGRLLANHLTQLSLQGVTLDTTWHPGLWRSQLDYRLHTEDFIGAQAVVHSGQVSVQHNPIWQPEGWVLARFSEQLEFGEWQARWFLMDRILGEFQVVADDEPWRGSFAWTDATLDITATRSQLTLDDPRAPLTLEHPYWALRSQAPFDQLELTLGSSRLTTQVGHATLAATEPRLSALVHNLGATGNLYLHWQSPLAEWAGLTGYDTDVQLRLTEMAWQDWLVVVASDSPLRAWQTLLSHNPQLSRFGLRLDAASPYEDLAGMIRLSGNGAPHSWQQRDIEFSLLAYDQALYQLLLWQTRQDLLKRGQTPPPEPELERQVRRELRNTRLMLQLLPLVEVTPQKAEVHLRLRDGMLYQHDRPVMRLDQFQSLLPW